MFCCFVCLFGLTLTGCLVRVVVCALCVFGVCVCVSWKVSLIVCVQFAGK